MTVKEKKNPFSYFLVIIILCCLFLFFSVNASSTYTASSMGRLARSYTMPTIYNDVNWTSLMDMNQNLNGFAWSISSSFDYGDIIRLQVRADSPYYRYLYRTWFGFNTSGMTDGYKQNDVKLNMRCMNKYNSYANWFGNISFVALTEAPIGNISDRFLFDRSTSYGNICLDEFSANTWESIPISSDFPFNTEGITYIGVVFESDRTQIEPGNPTAVSGIPYSLSVYYNNPYRPYLTVQSEEPPVCDIDVSPTSGASPLAVSFTDDSLGFTEGIDLAYLDYGDGNSYSGTYPGNDATRNYVYLDAGTYNYSYRLTHFGTNYYSNGTVTVTGDSTVNFKVIVRGLNGAYIGDATVNIWYDSGTMIDSDITDDFYGSADFYVNPSRYVNGNVTKDGYYTSNFTYYVCPTGYCSNEVWITLYTVNETPGSGDEFGNYLVTFKDAVTGEEVGYSNIEVYSDSGYTTLFYDEYSNALGVWTGLIPMDVVYYYKYPETTSYYSQTWSYNLTSSPAYKTVNLIPKSGATSTATPTPTITITTITPTVTYTYNDSNLSTLNVKERFTNLLVLAGFQNAESADLIFAMIIVLGCTALIGWITLSGSGAGMGAIIGFVFSLGLGLIPLWLLIAAIFFGCLYVALKLFGGTGE